MHRRTVLLLAVTCGVAVGNIYFPQALGPLVAAGLHTSPGTASLVVTATQTGYAAGILLLVPLGDSFRHRPFLVALLALTASACSRRAARRICRSWWRRARSSASPPSPRRWSRRWPRGWSPPTAGEP